MREPFIPLTKEEEAEVERALYANRYEFCECVCLLWKNGILVL